MKIPQGFERDLFQRLKPQIYVAVNAVNSMKAGVASSYLGNILKEYQSKSPQKIRQSVFTINTVDWYNPGRDYKTFMVPGILCILITVIGVLLTALNIVREKETGTIEQLNVTPISKIQFILGKLIPFGIIGLVQFTIGLIAGVFLFKIPIEGNLFLIYTFVAVYLFAVLGVGFFISTVSETQSQAVFVTLFFALIFILLSGLFTPIESMPLWAQKLTWFNPTAYMMRAVRMVMLKGSSLMDLRDGLGILLLMAILINAVVVWRYRKAE